MDMGAGAPAGRTEGADGLFAFDDFADFDFEGGHVAVPCLDAVAVVDFYEVAQSAGVESTEGYDAFGCGADVAAVWSGYVHAVVMDDFESAGIFPKSEGGANRTVPGKRWPDGWNVGHLFGAGFKSGNELLKTFGAKIDFLDYEVGGGL